MFFIMGINEGRKDFPFSQTVICSGCGAYGRYQVFMTYMCLSLFFIPCFKWNRRYFVQTSCCGAVYELDPEVGKQIARGENVDIKQRDLTPMRPGNRAMYKRCPVCGYETGENFTFCPHCGNRM